jgi:hypothetical protein
MTENNETPTPTAAGPEGTSTNGPAATVGSAAGSSESLPVPAVHLEDHLRQRVTGALASFASRASHINAAAAAGEIVSLVKQFVAQEVSRLTKK